MAQVTIYLPDDLRDQVKAAGLNASRICRDALEAAVRFQQQQGVPGDTVRLQGATTLVDCTNPGVPDDG